jgi:hypothetical protein
MLLYFASSSAAEFDAKVSLMSEEFADSFSTIITTTCHDMYVRDKKEKIKDDFQ